MTYILGWTYDDSAYVIADSALTFKPEPQDVESATRDRNTSFGELIMADDARVVREAALKVLHLDKFAVAYCGHVSTARSVVEQVVVALTSGLSPRAALESALISIGPFSSDKHICLIIAIPGMPKPSLLAFDSADSQGLQEVPAQTLAHFGSMPERYTDLSAQILGLFEPFAGQEPQPDRSLVRGLAMVQSFGIHEHLLPKGVGGCLSAPVAPAADVIFCTAGCSAPNR